ncbi:4-deoxy-L-threo-5-hexosulose-uronate ketol-isomerase [Arthrobacter subterraneus]|uniref:5-dehydro-4-deoxy-D-glucuronate isomerase n=1 Tax=Arthrobacter subterraneus TaxID=335973 RepID=A0A1G8K9K4_9MICC|nr:5-dehydro-4-deoxy-D-glucuronate isomerase [Arthrobacter subterraneus]SDI40138.1 4-deoxy-L-threo-5-hexosulose-uronate ketol-isomerase [Arthrobacter subterraneus]
MRRLWSTHPEDVDGLSNEDLRERFVVSDLFAPGEIRFSYAHDDRIVIGGAVLLGPSLQLNSPPELRSVDFLARRELGIVGLEGTVSVTSSDGSWDVSVHDVLYLPCGTSSVTLSGHGVVYLVSAPAHKRTTAALASRDEVEALHLGSPEEANVRTIRKYIHADGIESNQLVLGVTTLSAGSVWNTMPPHVHNRRTEIYLYDGLGDAVLFHQMGEPQNVRQLILGNRDAVVSPPWSIHSGSATAAYSFVWAMAGENIDYTDVEAVKPGDLR